MIGSKRDWFLKNLHFRLRNLHLGGETASPLGLLRKKVLFFSNTSFTHFLHKHEYEK